MARLLVFVCWTLIGTFVLAQKDAQHPGFTTTLTNKSLALFERFGYETLSQYMSDDNQYDFSVDAGKVGVELTNAVVKWFDPDYKVAVVYDEPVQGIDVHIKNVALDLNSPYLATFWLFWNYGVVSAAARDISVDAMFSTKAENGRINPEIQQCDISIGSLDLKFHGGMINKIMNLARKKISNKVTSLLDEKFCAYLESKLIPELQKHFLQTEDNIRLFDEFFVNHTILAQPLISKKYFHMAHDGKIFAITPGKNGGEPIRDDDNPFRKSPLAFVADFNRMVSVQISPWLAATLIYYVAKYHKLDMDFRDGSIPKDFAPYFQTTCSENDACAGTFFPILAEKHPNSSLAISFNFQSTPKVDLVKDKIRVMSIVDFTGGVVSNQQSDAPVIPIFSGKVDTEIFVQNFRFENTSLMADIKVNNVEIWEFNSNYEEIDQSSFELIMGIASEEFIQPRLMSLLGRGIVIPKAGPFTLKTGDVTVNENFITLSADFEF